MAEKVLNFPLKQDRKPNVIVFEEPGRGFEKNLGVKSSRRKQEISEDANEDNADFIDIAREVKEFGVTGFTKKEQKKSMQRYTEHLGAYKTKQQKVPYKMLMARVRAKQIKEEKLKSMEHAMGIFRKKKKNDNVKLTDKLNMGRWVDKSSISKSNIDNSMKIKKKDIMKLKK